MPDGITPVRYEDVADISGMLTILDVGDQGTQVMIEVDGLIPDGLYTVWADFYQAPGFTPDFAHELALGALGYDSNNPPTNPAGYVGNVIRADADGHGALDVVQPAGVGSWYTVVDGFGIPNYVLDAPVAEFHTVLAYHIDGKSWGARAGEAEGFDAFDATWVGIGGSFVTGCAPLNDLVGDLDGDGSVGFTDFQVLSASFGTEVSSYTDGDVNCNGSVGFADFLALAANFGQSLGATATANAVPEPSGSPLLIPALLGLLLVRPKRV